jgi:proline racemase
MRHLFQALDAHVAGASVRLITGGLPRLSGTSLQRRQASLIRQAGAVRRALILEPRGHRDLVGAVLTDTQTAGADAGLLFMDADGWPLVNGAATMAAAALACQRGLIVKPASEQGHMRVDFDTLAGTVGVDVTARPEQSVVDVTLTTVPAFVACPGAEARVWGRTVRVDLAYAGAFYAMLDTEAVGIPLEPSRLGELRRLGVDLVRALSGHEALTHPVDHARVDVAAVVFTGAPQQTDAHLRSVTITAGGAYDRSPNPDGTAAVMAILDEMGLLDPQQTFVHENLLGAVQRARIERRSQVAQTPALIVQVDGQVWMTGEHTFVVDDDDPFRDGFVL